MINNTY